MPINPRVLFRQSHRYGAVLVAIPFFVVIVTGILLQVKKEVAWVQPPTKRGVGKEPTVSFQTILDAVRGVPEAEVNDWPDIERLDVRPDRGIVKVRCQNNYEVQVDTSTGSILQVAFRRSDIIESIHDGSFFHEKAKLWVFLPVAVVVLGLWVTGMYLFVLPLSVRRRQRHAAHLRQATANPTGPDHAGRPDQAYRTNRFDGPAHPEQPARGDGL